MNTKIIEMIDKSFDELEKFEKDYEVTKFERKTISKVRDILNYLRDNTNLEIKNREKLRKKLEYLGLASFKVFENTDLEDLLSEIAGYFMKKYWIFIKLQFFLIVK